MAARRNTRKREAKAPAQKRGRPPALVASDKIFEQIKQLAAIHCTKEEAAGILGVSVPTLRNFFSAHEKAVECWEQGQATGKVSLRRWQYDKAKQGNTTMLIWLGKQLLEQTDKVENNGQIEHQHKHTIEAAASDLDAGLDQLIARTGARTGFGEDAGAYPSSSGSSATH